ncbi:MAG: cytochrome b N-terminal domain-containing protein [Limisphaerales bacterium]
MKRFSAWLESRTGAVSTARRILFEEIPGGARWRHAWAAALVFTFLTQVVTGFFLLAHYSASMHTAWESVFHLQHQVAGGALLRGLHAISAQAFVVLLVVLLMQSVILRAYRAPRELNWLLLLALLPLAIAMSATGWLLPMDQKGFWAARVPLNILGATPVVGPWLQQLLLGGSEFSHHTLTRFVALHTTVLPFVIGTILALYLWLACRHPAGSGERLRADNGRTPDSSDSRRPQSYWPEQALRNVVVCLTVLVTVLFVVVWPRLSGQGEVGIELLAPADPTEPYPAARPEWFMLWLFQFLKFFPGGTEAIGSVIVPGVVLLLLAIMPWTGRWRLGAVFNAAFLAIVIAGAGLLTWLAVRQDQADPEYRLAVQRAHADGERVRQLAASTNGIPVTGALTLVHGDALWQGPRLFARHCASCHRYDGHDGLGERPKEAPSAPDLKGFASREWIAGLLDPERVATDHYFGGTRFKAGKMVRYVQRNVAGFDVAEREQLAKVIVALSAEASLTSQKEADRRDAVNIDEGRALARSEAIGCTECHQFRQPDEDATAPDLTGYGSREWLVEFIGNPSHSRFYGTRNDRMPLFGKDEVISPEEIELIADWLRGDWYRPPVREK